VLRGRWLAGHALVLLFAGGFVALGVWQLNRNHEKHQKVEAERAAYAAPAPELTDTASPGTRAQASGTYDAAHEFLLRDQPRGDQVGNDVLTPLRLADGTAVIVDRGWLPSASAATPPPGGEVLVHGIVGASRPLSAQDSVRTINGRLSLPRVDVARIGAAVPYRLRPSWIEAQSQSPPDRAAGAPQLPVPPPPDPVNHLEYAIEWFGLALIPLVGWPVVLVRVRRRAHVTEH
jgi:cytochrome oxidase assembly protein ShyY1